MNGYKKYLFALIFLMAGIVLGIQLAGWIAPKKHKTPLTKNWTRPAITPKPAAKTISTPVPILRTSTASDPAATRQAVVPRKLPSAAEAARPKVAIVLDDWGYNLQALNTVLLIKEPLTLAILPHLTYSTQVAQKVHAAGHEVMLHMPMQPLGNAPLEKGTIMSGMNAQEVRGLLDAAIVSVPYVSGVNNHMGSKITQDARILKIIMTELHSRNLFFMNSMVTNSGVGREVAADLPIAYAERDIFLDNIRTEEAVLVELERLKQIAIRKGTAIGIGHDELVTLNAIRKVLPSWHAEGIQVVKLSDLIYPDSDNL